MKLIKQLAALAVVVIILVAIGSHFGWVPSAPVQRAAVPKQFNLPTAPTQQANATPVAQAPLPTSKLATNHGLPIRFRSWEWNAQLAFFLANGGPMTTQGSLMDKHGVTIEIKRQDDTDKMKTDQLDLANDLAAGNMNSTVGAHFVVIMGDGAAQYLAAMNALTKKLGPDYRAEIVGALGYSRGEDGWWGPQEWQDNPEAMKGGTTAGVLKDGDWNITLYKLGNDKIKNNPDPKTWDPDAMNWVAADTYLTAAEQYNAGACDERPVVRNGKRTNEPKHHTCIDAVTTWTPGDVNIARGRGGLVRLLSTAENVYQMPAVVIGIHKWDVAHAKQVQGLLAASFEAADQVKHFDTALSKGAQISANIYADQNAAYWAKYFRGTKERDKTGVTVPLGGSSVSNLGDNMLLFGLLEGSGGLDNSLFKATYEGFGNIVVQQYPDAVPSFPRVAEAVNLSFLQAVINESAPVKEADVDVQKFEETGPIPTESVLMKRNWAINFETGKSTFTPDAEKTLTELYQQLQIGGALAVEIEGHTDNVGSTDKNKTLSEERAFAVKRWLEAKAPTLFPANRVAVSAYGDTHPIAPNSTPEGRAQNRRVTVKLGTKG